MVSFLIGLANVLMVLTSVFLICLVLIQRGKGGGLAGAFGGVGGSSAFGTKAGDVFTRVTIYVAIAWFALAILLVVSSNSGSSSAFSRGVGGDGGEEVTEKAKDKNKVRDKDAGKAPSGGTDKEPANPGADPLLPGSNAKRADENVGGKTPVTPAHEKPAPPASPAEKPAADGKKTP